MKTHSQMKPQDIVLLLKIVCIQVDWNQKLMADSLGMSQSEVSESMARSKYAGLLDGKGKKVMSLALMDFLQFGIKYVFPQQPGALVRGIATAHSAPPLNTIFKSEENYVWPSAKGTLRGQSIIPLYPSVVDAVKDDILLHELLALVDGIRVGRAREKEMAIQELRKRIIDGE